MGEMELEAAVMIPPEQRPGDLDAVWLVVVEPDGAIRDVLWAADLPADAPAGDALPSLRDIVVLDEHYPVVAALASGLFRAARWPFTVLVRRDDSSVAVWAEDDLADVREDGLVRGGVDVRLGNSHILALVRHCGFQQDGARCGDSQTFVERPLIPVSCANRQGLAPHDFVW